MEEVDHFDDVTDTVPIQPAWVGEQYFITLASLELEMSKIYHDTLYIGCTDGTFALGDLHVAF